MKTLEVKHVTKKIKNGRVKTDILKDVNFSCSSGEFISIVGESGSGKSTLLQIIGGLDEQYEGDVFVNGSSLKKMNAKEKSHFHQQIVGFVFQSFYLLEHMSVWENLLLASRQKEKKRLEELLQELDILSLKHQKVATLSGGEKQRVAIARALVNDPSIILADEPTGALDQKNHDLIVSILKKIAQKGKLVLFVTHSKRMEQTADQVLSLIDGRIQNQKQKRIVPYVAPSCKMKRRKSVSFYAKLILAFENVTKKKYRNLLLAFASSIGIMSIVMMLHFNDGFKRMFLENSLKKDWIEVQKEEIFSEEEIKDLCSLKQVTFCQPNYKELLTYQQTLTFEENTILIEYLSTSLEGIEKRNLLGNLPKEGEILINDTIPKSKELLGKKVILHLNIQGKDFTISGLVSGILKTPQKNFIDYFYQVYIPFETLTKKASIKANALSLQGTNHDQLKHILEEKGYTTSLEENVQEQVRQIFDIITYVLLAIAAISLFVALLMIGILIYINVIERKKEIAIFRTLGYRHYDIWQVFYLESWFLSILTFLFASLLTFFLLSLCNSIFPTTILKAKPTIFFLGLCLSLFIYFFATFFPVLYALKIDPIVILKGE